MTAPTTTYPGQGNYGDVRGARRSARTYPLYRCSRCNARVRALGFVVDADNTYDEDEPMCAACCADAVGIKLS